MEKELYQEPEMETIELREEDIILTSGEDVPTCNCDNNVK